MEIAISTGLYYKKGYIEVLDVIKESGFKNIELFMNQTFEEVSLEDIKKAVEERGLKVVSIHTPLEFIAFPKKESEEYWIKKALEMSKVLGAKLIVTHMVLGTYFEEIPNTLDEVHKENLLKYKNNGDIIITTENMPSYTGNKFLGDMEALKKFVEENKISLTFDVTHCAASNLPLIATFKSVQPFVRNIHLSDYKDKGEHKLLGKGEVNIEEFLQYLAKEKYEYSITLELDFENKLRNNISSNEEALEGLRQSYLIMKRYL